MFMHNKDKRVKMYMLGGLNTAKVLFHKSKTGHDLSDWIDNGSYGYESITFL